MNLKIIQWSRNPLKNIGDILSDEVIVRRDLLLLRSKQFVWNIQDLDRQSIHSCSNVLIVSLEVSSQDLYEVEPIEKNMSR